PPEEVIHTVEDALQGTPIANVAPFPPPNCLCYDFARQGADSFAYYAVRYWLTDLAADDPTSSAVRVRVYVALKRAGIPLAVPGQALWVSMDDPEHRERKVQRELQHRVTALEQIEMFTGLSPNDRQQLAEGMRPAPFGRGERGWTRNRASDGGRRSAPRFCRRSRISSGWTTTRRKAGHAGRGGRARPMSARSSPAIVEIHRLANADPSRTMRR